VLRLLSTIISDSKGIISKLAYWHANQSSSLQTPVGSVATPTIVIPLTPQQKENEPDVEINILQNDEVIGCVMSGLSTSLKDLRNIIVHDEVAKNFFFLC